MLSLWWVTKTGPGSGLGALTNELGSAYEGRGAGEIAEGGCRGRQERELRNHAIGQPDECVRERHLDFKAGVQRSHDARGTGRLVVPGVLITAF